MAVGALAFAVFTTAVVFAWQLSHPEPSLPEPPPMVGFDLSAYPPGWTRLPDPPEVRSVAATAWTGSELLIWGGYEYTGYSDEDAQHTGYRYDPAEETWSSLPDSPLRGRTMPASAWTGREFLVWGGWDGGFREDPYFADGAAYDPETETWRSLPAAPIAARVPFSVWTGEELIVWGSQTRDRRFEDGAAYDPQSDSWRRIADVPIELTDGTAVWTGEVMIVFGAALHGGNFPESPTAIGAAYDPETDSWARIADSDLSPQASTAAWDGRRLIGWDYENRSASYDPMTDSWDPIPKIDIWTGECSPNAVGLEGAVFGDYCGVQVLYSEGLGRWQDVSRRPSPGDVVIPIAAGPVAFVLEHDREAKERRMFVFRPPSTTDASGGVLEPEQFVPEHTVVGDETRVPIVFPDGTEATVVYPTELDLARLGVQPQVSYLWKDDPPARFPIVFLLGADAPLGRYVDQEAGSTLVNTSEGGIEVFPAKGTDFERRFWIRYELPSWTVLVSVRDGLASAVQVAGSLTLRQTPSGFPVAETSGPIALSNESGEGEGPMLHIGSVGERAVLLWIERCTGGAGVDEVLGSGAYGSACLADGRVTADIYGDASAVEAIAEGLTIEGYAPAS